MFYKGEDRKSLLYKVCIGKWDIRQTQQGQKTEFENYEHYFRMISDSNFLPYGRSMLEGGKKYGNNYHLWKTHVDS